MFTFPSTFTIRRSLAAASGVSSAGVVPDSIGVAPSALLRRSGNNTEDEIMLPMVERDLGGRHLRNGGERWVASVGRGVGW